MKLIDFLDDWLENSHKEYVKHQTYIRYRSNINNYIRYSALGLMDLGDITRKDVQNFVNGLKKRTNHGNGKKPLSPGTINNTYIVLRCAFNYAEDYEMIDKNPCVRIKLAQKTNELSEKKCFTLDEQKQIENYIDSLKDPEYFCYIFDLYTGLRIGELCGLTWKNVDFVNKTVTVDSEIYSSVDDEGNWKIMTDTPKTKTSCRVIPLPPHLIKGLSKLYKSSKSPYVFGKSDGSPMTPWTMRWRYDEMLKKLGICHVKFHGLRHTFATRAIENGVDIKTLSEILGHASPSITLDIYTHSLDDHKREMMCKMKRI